MYGFPKILCKIASIGFLKIELNITIIKSNLPTPPARPLSFLKIDRELSESELHDPSILKFLVNERDEFLKCKKKLEDYIEKCHSLDKQNAVLQGKVTSSKSHEILYSVMLALGPALLGLLPSLSGEKIWTYIVVVIVGVGLIIGALWSKKVINK